MISQLLDKQIFDVKEKYTCRFCNHSFAKEITLTSHLCEKKRRHQQEKEIGVQWGLQAYLLFYSSTQLATKNKKTYQDFTETPYYTAFVKFGRYCVDIKCINFLSFTNWLLKNNKGIDHWCSDKLYEEWLTDYLRKEAVQDALERSFKTMTDYSNNHTELKNGYTDYFRYGNVNRILHSISNGKISPWVIFNCKSGIEFIENLTEDQLGMIMSWIDPEYWNSKFRDSHEDVQWTRKILETAGL